MRFKKKIFLEVNNWGTLLFLEEMESSRDSPKTEMSLSNGREGIQIKIRSKPPLGDAVACSPRAPLRIFSPRETGNFLAHGQTDMFQKGFPKRIFTVGNTTEKIRQITLFSPQKKRGGV